MAVSFEMVGKLKLAKESEKFKTLDVQEYPSGWVSKTLRLNFVSNSNRFNLQVKGGKYQDEHNEIPVFSKGYTDANGTKHKGESFRIPYKQRLTHPRLGEVANFKLFTIDLEKSSVRNGLQRLLERYNDGEAPSAEDLKKFGLTSAEELQAAYDKSLKKKVEFISENDFIDALHKILSSGKLDDKKVKITGTYDMQYSASNGRFYNNYMLQKVYLVDDSVDDMAQATVEFYFNSDSLDTSMVSEKGMYEVNGYVFTYDGSTKKNIPAPYTISFREGTDDISTKREKFLTKMFTTYGGDVKVTGAVVDLIDGAQKVSITEADLTEEQRELIELGFTTLRDILREMGQASMYGERVVANIYAKASYGYTKETVKETAYTSEDLVIPTSDSVEVVSEDDDTSIDDLFDI